MFSRATGSDGAAKDEGASLSSVLGTPALRTELALLVLLCIDSMRSDLTATFDPHSAHEPNTTNPPVAPSTPKDAKRDLISFDEPTRSDRQGDINSTQIQALRRSALTFFDKWRAGVMHRVCDVLCVRGETVRQAKARRKQILAEAEMQRQGISSLIDFDQDPFVQNAWNGNQKQGRGNIIETKILALDESKRDVVLNCVLLLLLSLEQYTAQSRVLLVHLANNLKLETDRLAALEKAIALGLLATAASQMDAEKTAKKQASNDAVNRRWKVGLAAVGGAVLIGVTGGLAAPLLAAGLGTVMGGLGLGVVSTYLGALAGSSVLVGSLFGAYGAKMTGRLMDRYAKEVQDFEFVPVQDPDRPLFQRDQEWADEQDAIDPAKREQHRLRVTIGISGWLSSPLDVSKPWEVIDANATEPFALRFELDAMLRLGNSLQDVLFSYAWDGLAYTVVSRTVLGALYAGLWPLGLIKVASVLDNPFSVALARADKAGKVLAHALIDGVQGKRPVNLIGYSVGARVIYACLIELAEQHAFGLVESVVLMGTPAPIDCKSWRQIRSVVASRVVNVYSTDDYVLGYLYRSAKLELGVAGLREVPDIHGIENVDMSKLVSGHDRYRYLVGTILVKIGFGDLNFNKVAEQDRALELAERKKQHIREQSKQKQVENQVEKPQPTTKVISPTTQGQLQTLITVTDEHAPPKPSQNQSSHVQRPAIYSQPKSSQQPTIRTSIAQQTLTNSRFNLSQVAPGSDPLSVSDDVASSPPSSRKASLSTASNLYQRQQPSRLVSAPAAPPQPRDLVETEQENSHKNPVKMTTSSDLVASDPVTDNVARSKPDVTVTEVLVFGGDRDDEEEIIEMRKVSIDDDDDDDDDDGSEFGLATVEPIPMDDFDYGLMQ
ncbi:hypothetical protein GQ44DRAFT_688806 [Phaeosphaeriaceae sp. PMI808]|nr:hypothetical protein GQ44DRAFT_688806 [Phaeosphaeriaceae sp. PMI808]